MDDRNKWIAAILAILLGGLGIHKFYLGRKTAGWIYLAFCWTGIPVLLSLVDFVILLIQGERTFDQKYNSGSDAREDGMQKIRCPACREKIWADANKCRYCATTLTSTATT